MREIIEHHASRMAVQLVNSKLESTRVFWRLKLGMTEAEAYDPAPVTCPAAAHTVG